MWHGLPDFDTLYLFSSNVPSWPYYRLSSAGSLLPILSHRLSSVTWETVVVVSVRDFAMMSFLT